MSSELCTRSAADLIDLYRTRRASPVEVTSAILQRIETLNPVLNAFCFVAPDALEQARRSESRWMRGAPQGALDGVPVSIKDLLLTAGWPTRRGSKTVDPAGPVARRSAGRCAIARERRGAAREDHDAGVRLERA